MNAVGVLSDSHGSLQRLAWAASEFGARQVTTLIHCGDITDPDAVEALDGFDVHWVLGNCDWDETGLRAAMSRCGHTCHGLRGVLEVEGRRLGFTHGHRFELFRAMTCSGEFDLVFHGHTHVRRDEHENGTRVLCPGALYRANPPGCVALSLADLDVEWIDFR